MKMQLATFLGTTLALLLQLPAIAIRLVNVFGNDASAVVEGANEKTKI